MPRPNKVDQHVQLELAVILTKVVNVSQPSLASQNHVTSYLSTHLAF
jgi:hypothetical protein